MRVRNTFFHRPESPVDPASLRISDSSLTGPDIGAAREDRITLALDELPNELRKILEDSHELHIRWVSPHAFDSVGPLLSRLSPGFHLFYTPQAGASHDSDSLCLFLRKAFGRLDCSSPDATFTALPNDRFSHATAFQYYQPLEDLSTLVRYGADELCPAGHASCASQVERLLGASSLDVSYDTISHALKITGLWPHQKQPLLVTSHPSYRTEVGVLGTDSPPNLEPHELGIAGHLTVLGQDKKPSAVLFSFPSRHRHSESKFASEFLDPTGLHPTLRLSISSGKPPSEDSYCSLHAYLTLPRTLFADKYQLGDELFLRSKNLTALRHITQPVDLEAPDYAVGFWGSAVLLELSPPGPAADRPWTAEVPLHLRYLAPAKGGYGSVEVPFPVVFWACAAEEGTKFPTNPFERVNLGYDGLFGPRTVFWHVDPQPEAGSRLMHSIKVPVLDTDKTAWVNAGTSAAVLLGFCWVAWKLLGVYLKSGYGVEARQPSKNGDKKTQ